MASFDFEECYWRYIPHQSTAGDFFEDNANTAHGWFDSHKEHFSAGVKELLTANATVEKADLKFLPFEVPMTRLEHDLDRRVLSPQAPASQKTKKHRYGVALSFAGSDRESAEALANIVRHAAFSVFYDDFYPEDPWGKDLVETFDRIYRKDSRYCVIFVSRDYNDRKWAIHERRSAQARALEEKGKEYILPIRVDDSELDAMPPTLGYISIEKGIEKIGKLLIRKLTTRKKST